MADNAMSILDVIQHHHIFNAEELTAFFLRDASKGILTPYPKGFGVTLWKNELTALAAFYGVCRNRRKMKRNQRNKTKLQRK